MKKDDGFTLAELLIVVAIIGVLVATSIPVFSSQLEKSREATDLANVRAAYAQIMAEAIGTENYPEPIPVKLKQKQSDWQTGLPITIGGITFDGTGNDNWIGKPDANGICMVSYEKDYGVIFNWNGGYSGTIAFSKRDFLNYDTLNRTGNIDTNQAYFSNQTFRIGSKEVTVRIYYAGAAPFKEALANWTLQTSTYENSPFYNVENDNKGKTKADGFAYYTYGEDHSINSFIYVSPTAVYETRDEGKTWYNITPKAK